MSVSEDPYKVLQVDPEAEGEVIEAAYRRLARKYHPDVSPEPDSNEKMIAINKAWEQLRDPVRRAALDRARRRTSGSAAWVAAASAQARTASGAGAPGVREPTEAEPSSPASGGTWPLGMNDPTANSSTAAGASGGGSSHGGPRAWTTGRVPIGGFSSGASSRPGGEGAAGPPPGRPSGSVLNFGRFAGWSLGEVARYEPEYLEWLDRTPIGRPYQAEIDELLRAKGRRSAVRPTDQGRGGPFRRR